MGTDYWVRVAERAGERYVFPEAIEDEMAWIMEFDRLWVEQAMDGVFEDEAALGQGGRETPRLSLVVGDPHSMKEN